MRRRERISLGVSDVEPPKVELEVLVNGAHIAGHVDVVAELCSECSVTVDGGDIVALEFVLALLKLVSAAAGGCPVVLEFCVYAVVEGLNSVGLYEESEKAQS